MKKNSKSSVKKRSPDRSLQHKNTASYKFSKKNLLHLAEKRAGAERVNMQDEDPYVCWPKTYCIFCHLCMNTDELKPYSKVTTISSSC